MSLLAALGLGLLIGLTLGALGGGGSILTVPALVYVLGERAQDATTGSLVIVGLTAAVAAVGHARAGAVRWRAGLAFAAAGVPTSFAGTWLNRGVDPDLLLGCFAGLMALAATALLVRSAAHHHDPGPSAPSGSVAVAVVQRSKTLVTAVKVLLAGAVVGFLTGFLGVGGGFVIVPALVLVLGFEMPVAVGTSLLVISLNSGVALLARSGHESFHWAVIVPFTMAAVLASLGGRRVSTRISPTSLTRAFAVLLLLVAAYVLLRVLLG